MAFILKDLAGSARVHHAHLDVSAQGQQEGAALVERHLQIVREGEREREPRSGRVDDGEYPFLSLLFPFSSFSPRFSPLSSLRRVDVASTGTSRQGLTLGEDGSVPCGAGLGLRKRPAERKTGGRSGRQTDRQTDRSSVLLVVETGRLLENMMAAVYLSVASSMQCVSGRRAAFWAELAWLRAF